MQVNVRHNIKPFLKELKKFEKNDIDNITRISLNETAKQLQKNTQLTMKKSFDRPTPGTLKSVYVIFAKAKKLKATITFRDWAQKYISIQVLGGTRPVTNTAVPTLNARLNKYGNIPGRRKGVGTKANQFRATIDGLYGVWERNKSTGKLKIIHRFVSNPQYEARFPFFRIAKKTANSYMPLKFKKVADYYIKKAGYK